MRKLLVLTLVATLAVLVLSMNISIKVVERLYLKERRHPMNPQLQRARPNTLSPSPTASRNWLRWRREGHATTARTGETASERTSDPQHDPVPRPL